MQPQAQAEEADLVRSLCSLQLPLLGLPILECYYASVHWVMVECGLQASRNWRNDSVPRSPPRDRVLSAGEAEWSSGFCPWNVAAEVEGLSA